MTVTLLLEHAPHPQAEARRTIEAGEFTIGRGPDVDWQIDDPDMFVSRRHCVVSVAEGQATVTDASRGGLFVDGASRALGTGNSIALEHGMRLRLGDFVFRVELAGDVQRPTPAAARGADFTWGEPTPPPDPVPRPDSLPPPYDDEPKPPRHVERRPMAEDDPFDLGDFAPPAAARNRPPPKLARGYFGSEPEQQPKPSEQTPAPDQALDWPDTTRFEPSAEPRAEPRAEPEPPRRQPPSATAPPGNDAALRTAFFRGLGLDSAKLGSDATTEAEMEAMGTRFRLLVEGLVHLLHTRAQEKQNVRVAQTVIGRADVNPLKFSATTDDAVTALVAGRGRGYLEPEAAIHAAYRDLADHQVRTWSALQTALRRMIDRFEPQAIERELEAAGLLEVLLAGGRGAKLWQLYQQRYRDIARSAEERFLGEVGADFRDAYDRMEEKNR